MNDARIIREDDDTWGLMHLPLQAGFGLTLAGAAVASLLVGTAGGYAWRASTLLPAISAVWFGAVSIAYPDHVGSLGALGGTACAVWGVSFLVSSVLATPRWESPSTARRLSRP